MTQDELRRKCEDECDWKSVSAIQRHFGLGYSKAAEIQEALLQKEMEIERLNKVHENKNLRYETLRKQVAMIDRRSRELSESKKENESLQEKLAVARELALLIEAEGGHGYKVHALAKQLQQIGEV